MLGHQLRDESHSLFVIDGRLHADLDARRPIERRVAGAALAFILRFAVAADREVRAFRNQIVDAREKVLVRPHRARP